jgi:hypothetical protein
MTDNAMVPASGGSVLSFGQTRLDAGDFIPPRVKIIQAMSDEKDVKGDGPLGIVNEGDWFNTLTQECYGPKLRFIPISPFKQRILLVRSERRADVEAALGTTLSEGDGLKCRSFDMIKGQGEPGIACDACPLAQWRDNLPPFCSETYNVAAINEMGDLIILSFSRSSAKTGKQMFSQLRLTAGLPWGFVYEASTREEKGVQGRYHVPLVRRVERSTPELVNLAEHFARQLEGVVIDVSPAAEDDNGSTGGQQDPGFAPWESDPTTPAS